MFAPLLAEISKPPDGFAPPGTEIFDYTKNCFIGDGKFCIDKPSFWMLMSAVIIAVLLIAAFRNPKIIPKGLQNALESIIEFIRNGIVMEVMGPDGLPFLPFLTALFLFIWVNNTFEVIPFIQFPSTSRMAMPAILAILVCPEGYRIELPRFGLADQAFTMPGPSTAEIRETVEAWEPRAKQLLDERRDAYDEFTVHVLDYVQLRTEA